MMRSKKNLVGILAIASQTCEVDAFSPSTKYAIARRRSSSSLHLDAEASAASIRLLTPRGAGTNIDNAMVGESSSPPSYRSYCPRCQRPAPTCLCHALPRDGPIALPNLRVLILQHPREARKRKRTSTVPLIGLCLDDVTICVGTRFGCDDDNKEQKLASCPEALREVLNKPGEDVILLYPGETALPLHEREVALEGEMASSENALKDEKVTLVVIDGTWAQTQVIFQQSPCLQRLPQYMFTEDTESLFDPIRQEPASHCTSTLEAVSRALRIVGGNSSNKEGDKGNDDKAVAVAAADALENSLRAMVKGQMQYAKDATKSRPRTKNNNRDDDAAVASKGRKVRKRRQAQLSLPKPMTEEEIEASRIRFIYVAHLG